MGRILTLRYWIPSTAVQRIARALLKIARLPALSVQEDRPFVWYPGMCTLGRVLHHRKLGLGGQTQSCRCSHTALTR